MAPLMIDKWGDSVNISDAEVQRALSSGYRYASAPTTTTTPAPTTYSAPAPTQTYSAPAPTLSTAIQNWAVNGGTFRGTQDDYNQYLSTHPQTTTTTSSGGYRQTNINDWVKRADAGETVRASFTNPEDIALLKQQGYTLTPYGSASDMLALSKTAQPTQTATGTQTPAVLSGLTSPVPKVGYVKGYDTNNNYAPIYVQAGKYVPGVSLTPRTTSTLTPEKMQTQTTPQIPGVNLNQTFPDLSTVAGAKQTMDWIKAYLQAGQQTPTEKQQQSILDSMAMLTGNLADKGADTLTMQQQAKLPEMKQALSVLNTQIATEAAKYEALLKTNENKPITMDSIIGNQRAIINAKGADLGVLQAQAQGLQGQITAAEQTIKDAIDLKYSTIQAQLEVKQAQLAALEPILTREERERALMQQFALDQQAQELADKKAEDTSIQNLMLKAIELGVTDTDVLNRIAKSGSLQDALSVLAGSTDQFAQGSSEDWTTDYKNWVLAGGEAGTGMSFADWQGKVNPNGAGGVFGGTSQIDLIESKITNAEKLTGAAGRSGMRTALESWFVGSTEFTQLENELDTIKTNILTLATDPTIRKYFGPQMSNADVKLMMSGGTTLDARAQTKEQMEQELTRLKDMLRRMRASIPSQTSSDDGFDWGSM